MKNDYKEEKVLSIETYLVWKNQRISAKDFIKEAIKELEDYKSRIDKAYKFIETEYNTYPSAEEWRNALKKILKGEKNDKN